MSFRSFKATYARLIQTAYNGQTPAPPSCNHPVNGTLTYQVIGWHYNKTTIEALLPPTFINLASFILLLVAMFTGNKVVYTRDPIDLNALLLLPMDGRIRGKVRVDLESERIYVPRITRD